ARAILAVGSGGPSAWGMAPWSRGAPRLRVLMYHRFGDTPYDPFCVSLPAFDAQLAWLAERRLAVSLSGIEGFLPGDKRLRDGAILVTSDDGLRSLYRDALPLLQRHHIPAVAFVPAGLIDDHTGPAANAGWPEPHVTWDELGAVGAGGVTIGSHGWT